MRRPAFVTIAAFAIAAMLFASPALAQQGAADPRPARPTLTVADFDTDRTGWMPPPKLGQTLAELLTNRLVEGGPFRMLDRVWIVSSPDHRGIVPFDVLLDRAAGAGVEFLVAGSITRFSLERQSTTTVGIAPP